MPRRRQAEKREVAPDAKYQSILVARVINNVLRNGKKSVSERIVYKAFDAVERELKKPSLDVFEQAIKNITPILEVKPRRVGGATYQVPVEVRSDRGTALAVRWLINAAKARAGKPMADRLAAELIDASKGQGAAAKRRDDLHKMAEANRAFVHYRW
ncbi:MAG: 30S ribosomal protein S7 [Chloroflexi bacterium]|nr:30S ribosomal protein S7 [Chloroflexota bacterium]